MSTRTESKVSSDLEKMRAMIDSLPEEARRRIYTAAAIVRQLVEKDDKRPEMELAVTLVVAELAEER